VAFRIGPRLNAAGRIDTAELALSLFEERDSERAEAIARELSARNSERQSLERRVVEEARKKIEADPESAEAAVVVEADPGWHRGVLGIAASRLAREYHRPVLLFGIDGDRASGSGRSIPGVSLHGLLSEMAHHFVEFGGHEQACGATLAASGLEAFAAEARALFQERIAADARKRVEAVDAELPLDRLDEALRGELSLLEPHGAGNPAPLFLARDVRAAYPFLPAGSQGLRGRLRSGRGDVRCVAWRPDAGLAQMSADGVAMDLLYRIPPDRGDWGLQVEVVDARGAGAAA
jgi:single-stranded-DNA-specific exonuclease